MITLANEAEIFSLRPETPITDRKDIYIFLTSSQAPVNRNNR